MGRYSLSTFPCVSGKEKEKSKKLQEKQNDDSEKKQRRESGQLYDAYYSGGKSAGVGARSALAANYGNGMAAEAFTTASLMPRTFFDAVFASAISASFIPIFNEYLKKKGKKEAFALSNRFITLMGLVTLLMTVVCEIFSSQFVWLFAAGYDNETAALAAQLSHVMFPTIFYGHCLFFCRNLTVLG